MKKTVSHKESWSLIATMEFFSILDIYNLKLRIFTPDQRIVRSEQVYDGVNGHFSYMPKWDVETGLKK